MIVLLNEIIDKNKKSPVVIVDIKRACDSYTYQKDERDNSM
jgi:hypothetical protein